MPERPVALVTGARRGIGRAIAEALAAAGFDLAVADIADEADEAFGRIRALGAGALFVRSDVGDLAGHAATLRAVLGHFDRIDCLVNNAGIASPVRGDLLDLQPEHYDRVMAVNLRGPLFLTQAVARWMLANPAAAGRYRSIVNVSSVSAALARPSAPTTASPRPAWRCSPGCWPCASPLRASACSRSGRGSSAPT